MPSSKTKWTAKKILCYGWIDLAVFCLSILFISLLLNMFFNGHMVTTPWPRELTVNDIRNGDATVLWSYWTFGILFFCLAFLHLVLSILICRTILCQYKLYWNNSPTKLSWPKQAVYYICIFLGSLVAFVLPIYFVKKGYFTNIQGYSKDQPNWNPLPKRSGWKYWTCGGAMVLISNIVFIGLPVSLSFLSAKKPYYNALNCKRFYQLSENKPNFLYIYYDRTDSWRVKDAIDGLDENHRKAFNDFTYYANNISLSDTTVSSVPYLSFGYTANLLDKKEISSPIREVNVPSLDSSKTNVTFPGNCYINFNELSVQDLYKYSLANFIAFWNYLGYGITNVGNYPYYGSQSPFLFSPNNSLEMNEEMRNEFGFKNFTGVNSNELQTYHKREVYYDNIDDAYTLGNLSKEINFVPTNTGVFTAFYSQQNHWDFAVKKKGGGYCKLYGNSPEHHHHAIHDSLIDLSDFLIWFRTNHTEIYNKTTIIINSDHGHCFEDHNDEPSALARAAGFAPVFMVKPMNATPVDSSQHEPFHINEDLISAADQLPLLRTLIHPDWKPTSTLDPWDPKNRLNLPNLKLSNFNSYRSTFNDSTDLWNREFKVMRPWDWRYMYWRKEIVMSRIRTFKQTHKDKTSVFDPENWDKFQWNV